jgi:PAS domain S-box-containing protein
MALSRLDPSNRDQALRSLTELTAHTLGVERVSIWQFSDDHRRMDCLDAYRCADRSHQREASLHVDQYPAYFQALSESLTVAARDARRDLRTREFTDDYLTPLGITSMMDVPVWLCGRVVGIVCNEHIGPLRSWTADDEAFAAHVADVVALCLEHGNRRRMESSQRELVVEQARLARETRRRAIAWRNVVSSIADAVWIYDDSGEVIFANDAGRLLLGVGADDRPLMLAQEWEIRAVTGELLPPERWPSTRALRGEVVHGLVLRLVSRRTGAIKYVRVSASPFGDDPRRAVSVASDVTDQHQFERLKQQFLAIAAHELRSPVTVMKGYAQLLLTQETPLPEGTQRMLRAIERSATRMDRLVQDLLVAATLDQLELQFARVDLLVLLKDLVADYASRQGRVVLRLGDVAGPVWIEGDAGRLEQVFSNLIDNALKFSPGGGEVEVTLTVGKLQAVVAVTDHGVGIPAAHQPHVFEAAYRAHESMKLPGMGMGLHLARQIVARHGGTMWFESTEGAGSPFYVALPGEAGT